MKPRPSSVAGACLLLLAPASAVLATSACGLSGYGLMPISSDAATVTVLDSTLAIDAGPDTALSLPFDTGVFDTGVVDTAIVDMGEPDTRANIPDSADVSDAAKEAMPADAAPDGGSSCSSCADAGGACTDAGACEFSCSGACDWSCPANTRCALSCSQPSSGCSSVTAKGKGTWAIQCGSGTCGGAVTCAGSSCTIDCENGSCGGSVACSAKTCAIDCHSGACGGHVSCSSSANCGVECVPGSCGGSVCCDAGACKVPEASTCN